MARRTQEARTKATTKALLDAARTLFGADGYSATSLSAIARRAGVTKGALYHHYRDKQSMFEAVFEREQRRMAAAADQAYRAEQDSWSGIVASCRAFFEITLDIDVQRITVLDAPAVMGWERVREIESHYGQRMLRHGLEQAMRDDTVRPRPVEPIVALLIGAMCEGALLVARSEDPAGTAGEVFEELRLQLEALRQQPARA